MYPLVYGTSDARVSYFASKELKASIALRSSVNRVDLLRNSGIAAAACDDKRVYIVDFATGLHQPCIKHILTSHSSYVLVVKFSHNGQLLASSSDDLHGCFVHHVETDYTRLEHLKYDTPIRDIVFSADSSRVFGACDDRYIAVWDVESNQLFTRLGDHTHPVITLAFHPMANILISGAVCC
jgi:WD40 repeat protein